MAAITPNKALLKRRGPLRNPFRTSVNTGTACPSLILSAEYLDSESPTPTCRGRWKHPLTVETEIQRVQAHTVYCTSWTCRPVAEACGTDLVHRQRHAALIRGTAQSHMNCQFRAHGAPEKSGAVSLCGGRLVMHPSESHMPTQTRNLNPSARNAFPTP